jgi:D-3-phosphoglycerate dehydrogenase
MRKINISQKIKKGQWKERTWTWVENYPVFRLTGQTFGLVALGSIGRNVAGRAQAFGFKVIAVDPFVSADDAKLLGVELVDFDTLLKTSDVISIHAPLSESTFHMFNSVTFEKMKKTAYLVNTARGGLVDNTAIYHALKAGDIAGAGLDVTENEPCLADEPLFTLDNVIITGHTAGYSEDSLLALRRGVFSQIVEVFKGGKPKYWLNQ